MSSAPGYTVMALFAMLVVLQVAVVVGRVRSNRKRKRVAELRPAIETALAMYVADPQAEAPEAPDTKLGKLVMREVALEAIAELRGREGERLSALLEDMGTVDELCDDLLAKDPVQRRRAAEDLGELRSPETAEALLFGVRDPDRNSRLACACALAELGEGEYAHTVIDAADEAAGLRPGAAAAVILAVGMHNPEQLAYALSPDRTSAGRRLAANVAAELRLAEHAPLLRAMLDDPDPEIVTRAARGLGAIGDADSVDALVAIVESPERVWFSRAVAARSLGVIGDPRAVPALKAMLEGSDRWLTRDRAAGALAQLGDDGREALERARGSRTEGVRELAAVALEA